jgi:hypothetical protein
MPATFDHVVFWGDSDAPESWLEVEQRGRQPTLLLNVQVNVG